MACCEGVRRKSPGNMICLGIFTLAEGFMIGIVISFYKAQDVFIALGICVVVVFGNFFCLRYQFLPLLIVYCVQSTFSNFCSKLNTYASFGSTWQICNNFWFKLLMYFLTLLGKICNGNQLFCTVLNSVFF